MSEKPVWAVMVSYCPSIELLSAAVLALDGQVQGLCIVDNGSPASQREALRALASGERRHLLELGANLGVATAQNRGIQFARERGADAVLLLDQDSVAAPDMVARLRAGLGKLRRQGVALAAVGPRLVDRRSGASSPFVRFRFPGIRKLHCGNGLQTLFETDFLISSGTLIPVAVLDVVGLPEDALFIDNVDLEWSFRARSCGVPLYGVCDAILEHSIGDRVIRILGVTLYRHGTVRQYYITRNRILLYRRSYAPVAWIVQDAARVFIKVLLSIVFFPKRRENLRMMWRGFSDGIRGRDGPLD